MQGNEETLRNRNVWLSAELDKKMESKDSKEKTVCVIGGCGFIGSWLVRLLLDRGYTVHATVKDLNDENETKHLKALEEHESHRLRIFQIDLLDYDSIVRAITGVNGVFHLASRCIIDKVVDPEVFKHGFTGFAAHMSKEEANLIVQEPGVCPCFLIKS
ncbi:hypothetical protein POM88_051103 [Heracleum sosnowskyi]|uniref:NAD(P)-binding domain-containing protein n=1 Tax=Heracleum sosnowskyi TaxID=360622 RepID=A0AAD8GYX0_9APIA|nr:hypothetical protein POM88_051103 [Heracleum sosnowskyi]